MKAKGRKKIYEYHANINPKKAGMGIIIPNKVELRAKKITKGSEWPLYDDERINPSRRHSSLKCVCVKQAANYKKQELIELNGETDKSKIIVEDFNTCISKSERTTKQKTSKDIEALNNTINQ